MADMHLLMSSLLTASAAFRYSQSQKEERALCGSYFVHRIKSVCLMAEMGHYGRSNSRPKHRHDRNPLKADIVSRPSGYGRELCGILGDEADQAA